MKRNAITPETPERFAAPYSISKSKLEALTRLLKSDYKSYWLR